MAVLCGAAFSAAPSFANPGYFFKTIAVVDSNPTPTHGAFSALGLASINDAGQVAFTGSTFCSGLNVCSGVFTVAPSGTVTKIIDGGGPFLAYPYQTFYDAIVNNAIVNQIGSVSFGVQNVASGGTPSSSWLDLWKNAQVRQIAPVRAIAAPTGNIYLNPRLLNSSKVVYGASDTQTLTIAQKGRPPQPAAPGYCSSTNGTGSALNGIVATRGGPGSAPCVETGILVTNIPTGATQLRVPSDGTYGQLSTVTVNQVGTVAFTSRNLPGRSTHVEDLFLQKAGAATQPLAEIDNGACANAPPPSGTCQYRGYSNSLAINSKGQVLADVAISNWTSGNPNPSINNGVTLNGDAQNGQVVWPGMVINGCTVHDAITGPRSINKYGQIVLLLNCSPSIGPGRPNNALVVATPPIRP